MTINVKHYDIEVQVTIPDDSEIDTVKSTINGLLIICGFHENLIFNNENETE